MARADSQVVAVPREVGDMNALKVINESDRKVIEERIADIEQTTAAELVVAVATESGRYDRAESIAGIVLALVALGIANWIPWWFQESGDWSEPALNLIFQALAVTIGFIAGNFSASYWFPLRRILTSRQEQISEANKAAAHIFYNHQLRETRSRCGVLIYLSLFERRIVILPDESCAEALGTENTQKICDSTIAELKTGKHRQAILHALDQLAIELTEKRPADRHFNKNELADRVLVFHRS